MQSRRVVLGEACKFGVVPRIVITKPPINGALLVQTEVVRIPASDPVCPARCHAPPSSITNRWSAIAGRTVFPMRKCPIPARVYEIDITIK